jgi:hypothetical protein
VNDFFSLIVGALAGIVAFVFVAWRIERKRSLLARMKIQRELPFRSGEASDGRTESELVAR